MTDPSASIPESRAARLQELAEIREKLKALGVSDPLTRLLPKPGDGGDREKLEKLVEGLEGLERGTVGEEKPGSPLMRKPGLW